jgi:hypothetical protein
MDVFWVVAPCTLVKVYRRFRGICCSIIRAMGNIPEKSSSENFSNSSITIYCLTMKVVDIPTDGQTHSMKQELIFFGIHKPRYNRLHWVSPCFTVLHTPERELG